MNKIKNIIIILTMILVTMIIFMPNANAAGLTISFSKSNANVGDKVNITVNGNGIAGRISLSVSGNATLSQNSVWVDNSSTSVTANITGEGNIKITATPVDASDSVTAEPFVTPTAGTIKVSGTSSSANTNNNENTEKKQENSQEKSNVTTLSNLGIKPNDFSGFSPSKTSYSVTVPNEVESVEVYANKGHSGQTISGTGTKKLAEGANTVNVTVTAEDGKTTKTYTINITREEKKEEDDEEEEKEEQEEEETTATTFGLKELTIDGINLQPKFQAGVYEYKIELREDLQKLDLTALATEEDANIEITGNENLQEGENIITIIVKNKNDEETIAYQIIVNKVLASEEIVDNQAGQEQNIMLLAVIGGVSLFIIIVIIVVIVKKHKKEDDSSMPYYNLMDNLDSDEYNDVEQEDEVEDFYEETPKKKKRSKGKRFK